MTAVTIHSDFGAQENKICCCFHYSPSICHEVMWLDAMMLVFWMLSFKLAFSLASPLSPSLRGSLVHLHAPPLEWFHLHIWAIDTSPSNLDSSLWFTQPNTSHDLLWQILFFLGSKIIMDVVCSHAIKRSLLLKIKAMTNLDSILKSRDIILPKMSM